MKKNLLFAIPALLLAGAVMRSGFTHAWIESLDGGGRSIQLRIWDWWSPSGAHA